MLFTSLFGFFMIFIVAGSIRFPPQDLRVTFLDVGQGDATLVEFPNGETLVIDGGDRRAGKYALAPYLWQRRIKKIDWLIVSHPQFDHIGGLPFILKKFKVDTVLTNGEHPESKIYRQFQKIRLQTGANHRVLRSKTETLHISDCHFSFLPAFEEIFPQREDLNNRSIVFRLQCAQKHTQPISFLFTGDIEAERELQLLADQSALRSTVLKVPHHGSRSSSLAAFIVAVSPKVAVFSVGKKNRYRHPHRSVVERYTKLGTRQLRTDQVGAVIIETGTQTSIETFLSQKWQRIIWNKTIFLQEWNNIRKIFLRKL